MPRLLDGMTAEEIAPIIRQYEVEGDPLSGPHVPDGGDLARVVNAVGAAGYKITWGVECKAAAAP